MNSRSTGLITSLSVFALWAAPYHLNQSSKALDINGEHPFAAVPQQPSTSPRSGAADYQIQANEILRVDDATMFRENCSEKQTSADPRQWECAVIALVPDPVHTRLGLFF